MKLREIAHSRTGDKGDTSNISLIAFDARGLSAAGANVTAARVQGALRRHRRGEVVRYELPRIGALNFVLHGRWAAA